MSILIKKEVIETEMVDKTEHFLTSFSVPPIIAEQTIHVLKTFSSFLDEYNYSDNNDYHTFFVFCFIQSHHMLNVRIPHNIIRRMKELLEMHR